MRAMTFVQIKPLPLYMEAVHQARFAQQVAADKVFALDIRYCSGCRKEIPKEFTFCSQACYARMIQPVPASSPDIVEPNVPDDDSEDSYEGRGEPPL